MRLIPFLLLHVFAWPLLASQDDGYQEGKELASSLNKRFGTISEGTLDLLPKYQSSGTKEEKRWEAQIESAKGEYQKVSQNNVDGHAQEDLKFLGEKALREDESLAQNLRELESDFGDLPESLRNGIDISKNAAEVLAEGSSGKLEPSDEIMVQKYQVKCQTSRPKEMVEVFNVLRRPKVTITPEQREYSWTEKWTETREVWLGWKIITFGIKQDEEILHSKIVKSSTRPSHIPSNRVRVTTIRPMNVQVGPDKWWVSKLEYKKRIDRGEHCDLISVTCLNKSDRRIMGEIIHRECWKWRQVYSCQFKAKNDCASGIFSHCMPISQKCKIHADNKCHLWERTMECAKESGRQLETKITGSPIFCLDGKCKPKKSEPNKDFHQALTQLSALKELEGGQGASTSIFTGEPGICGITIASGLTSNCCKVSGWEMFVSCDEQEKQLKAKRQQESCHANGTYCSHSFLGICTHEKETFCCFDNKLQRIIHEQGRPQIGIFWGTSKNPNCRGFTPEELARLDFSKMDFSEYVADIERSYKGQNLAKMQDQIKRKMQAMQQEGFNQSEQAKL